MHLDAFTMAFMTVVVGTILGTLLLLAWFQNRGARAVLWWGVAFLVGTVGLLLLMMRDFTGAPLSIQLGNVAVILAYGLMWTGNRVFEGRPARPLAIAAGPAIWLLACQVPAFMGDINSRVALSSLLLAMYIAGAGLETWRGRIEPLMSRWPTILVLGSNAALFVLRAIAALVSPISGDGAGPMTSIGWFTPVGFATLVYTIVFAFVLLMMTKERTELRHKTASLVDPLTGMANRRAFLENAERHLQGRPAPGRSSAVLLFDLDHFKEVNDRFGHAIGDRVLNMFATVIASSLGPKDFAGRLGGEEFAAVLADSDPAGAVALAELIRERFAEEAVEVDGQPVLGTVSIGIAMADDPASSIDELLARADGALYRAKRQGRDRVEVADVNVRSRADGGIRVAPDAPSLVPRAAGRRVKVVDLDLGAAVQRVALGRR